MVEILKVLDLTPTDAVMIVVWALFFVCLWRVLSAICWKPLLALVEAREAATVGASSKVKSLAQEAEDLARAYENEILKARMEGVRAKSVLVQDAKAKAQAELAAAEQAALSASKQASAEMQKDASKVERELEGQITLLSDQALVRMGIQ